MNHAELWQRYRRHLCDVPSIGMRLDISRMGFDDSPACLGAFLESMAAPIERALDAMEKLEAGARANADEDRMVGHYWLRSPELAPDESIRSDIEKTISAVKQFARAVSSGEVTPSSGDAFYIVLVIGIGGSALGPQLLIDALGTTEDSVIVRFLDNTDPDGIDRVIAELDETLAQTLTIVMSKSGGTRETRNTMLEVTAAYKRAGLDFAKHAVAVTCKGSALADQAAKESWLRVFEIWDWVGGRTSITSAVGLLPAALLGADVDAFLAGARECDAVTRQRDVAANPAALLALMWHHAGGGKGSRNMVVLPYRDRLRLFGQYLQQLVMESTGKLRDRDGGTVHHGLTVYGNKGSTDQHAFVQQLREGPDDYFATFIGFIQSRDRESIDVEEGVTTGDYLNAFLLGTRDALTDAGHPSLMISFEKLDAYSLGALIALFERAVGLYAELVNVNAYDQPGVEAGKEAAESVLVLQREVLALLAKRAGSALTVEEIADGIGRLDAMETIHHVLEHAAANRHSRLAGPDHGIKRISGDDPLAAKFATT